MKELLSNNLGFCLWFIGFILFGIMCIIDLIDRAIFYDPFRPLPNSIWHLLILFLCCLLWPIVYVIAFVINIKSAK